MHYFMNYIIKFISCAHILLYNLPFLCLQDIIQVDFDVKIPEHEDREGIKNLLQQVS